MRRYCRYKYQSPSSLRYEIVEGEFFRSNEENILFELKNDKTYKNANITINKVNGNYMYTLFKGDTNYPMDMILSGYETIPLSQGKTSINIILSNPFLKSNSMISDKKDSPFYLAFYVKDPSHHIYQYYYKRQKYLFVFRWDL